MEKFKIVVYQRWQQGTQSGTRVLGTIETDIDAAGIHQLGRAAKEKIKKLAVGLVDNEKIGALPTVESFNVLAKPRDGAHIVVTLGAVKKALVAKHPVTRGGRPIEPPRKLRTMTSVRRG